MAAGAILGGLVGGRFSDATYKKHAKQVKNKDEIHAEMRLGGSVFYGSLILQFLAFIAFGWCIQENVHYGIGLVCLFFGMYRRSDNKTQSSMNLFCMILTKWVLLDSWIFAHGSKCDSFRVPRGLFLKTRCFCHW